VRTIFSGPNIKTDARELFRIAADGSFVIAMLAFGEICLRKEGLEKLLHLTFAFYGPGNRTTRKSRIKVFDKQIQNQLKFKL